MWRKEGATERGRGERAEGVRKGDMAAGNYKGGTLRRTLASTQYTAHKTTQNATSVLQIQKCKWVYKLSTLYCDA